MKPLRWLALSVFLSVPFALTVLAADTALVVTARGGGLASGWFSSRGLEAELDGSIAFELPGLVLTGFGYGRGVLEVPALCGSGWAVVWARAEREGACPEDLVAGFAVEDSPALGSGSVAGTCYLAVFRDGTRADYRGTFVTQASSRLVPAVRPGTLALEGEMTLTLTLFACDPATEFPWESARWPDDMLADLVRRLSPSLGS